MNEIGIKEEAEERPTKEQKMHIKVQLIQNGPVYNCQTNGKETILSMIKNKLSHENIKKSTEHSLFKMVSQGCIVNFGLPTGVLKEDEDYQCIYKKELGYNTDALVREFDVARFDYSWDIKYFYVKFNKDRTDSPNVSRMSKIADIIQVPFFYGKETFFQALVRDGRFDVERNGQLAIRSCQFNVESKNVIVALQDDASPYTENCFEFYKSKAKTITEEVVALTMPSFASDKASNQVPEVPLNSNITPTKVAGASCSKSEIVEPEMSNHSTPLETCTTTYKIESLDDLKTFIEAHFEFKVEKEQTVREEKKRSSKIKKVYKNNYDLFALEEEHQMTKSDHLELATLCDSVGAVMVEYWGGQKGFIGTCFRVGGKYIMTNQHVLDIVQSKSTLLDKAYADFAYKEEEPREAFEFYGWKEGLKAVVSSKELDYAILELKLGNEKFPPSITSKYAIPLSINCPQEGIFLTFVGHPGDSPTVTNTFCPIKSPDTLHESVVIALRKKNETDVVTLHNKDRQTYDVNTLFHGSSGSPGILFKEKILMVLHCRGFFLNDQEKSIIEQGILMSAIMADVNCKIKAGLLGNLTLGHIFGN